MSHIRSTYQQVLFGDITKVSISFCGTRSESLRASFGFGKRGARNNSISFFHHVQEKAKRLGNPVDDTYDSVEADKSCRSKHYHQFARLIDAR